MEAHLTQKESGEFEEGEIREAPPMAVSASENREAPLPSIATINTQAPQLRKHNPHALIHKSSASGIPTPSSLAKSRSKKIKKKKEKRLTTANPRKHNKISPEDAQNNICKFFLSGSCTFKECRFSHDLSKVPCKYFHSKGLCTSKDKCKFSHADLKPDQKRKFFQDNEAFIFNVYKQKGERMKYARDYEMFLRWKAKKTEQQPDTALLPNALNDKGETKDFIVRELVRQPDNIQKQVLRDNNRKVEPGLDYLPMTSGELAKAMEQKGKAQNGKGKLVGGTNQKPLLSAFDSPPEFDES